MVDGAMVGGAWGDEVPTVGDVIFAVRVDLNEQRLHLTQVWPVFHAQRCADSVPWLVATPIP